MMPLGDTYIITGKIQMVTDIPIELITSAKLQEALASYVTTTDAENFVTTDELGFYIQSGDTVTELIITYLTATQFSVTGPFRHKGSQLTF
jgi:protein involved in sex pheromone biosynthesis